MNISILGSTGSIGTQTLSVIESHPDLFNVTSLSCGSNIDLLETQARKFKPDTVSVASEKDASDLRSRLKDTGIKVMSGMDGLLSTAADPRSDILVTGIVGMKGIRPTIEAIKAGKNIALANKETLVCAGHIIMPLAKEYNAKIIPVDSEHSAIFQSLHGNEDNPIKKIILTASGGPFAGMTRDDLEKVTLEDALSNPNWKMGKKVTVDSADMVNKGLEVMEAGWLFNVRRDQIEVAVHRQSILHSAVEFEDGAIIGQMGLPDMRLPIQYALTYPKRLKSPVESLDLFKVSTLSFTKPDLNVFRGLSLAFSAMDKGGNIPTAFNAADEAAVGLFLQRKIRFVEIPELIEKAMNDVRFIEDPDVDEIEETEKEAIESVVK
jgi:1-deoxy-D-xylulose-5-phosphate reductoisomerase